MAARSRNRGSELNKRWGVEVRHALYRESGDWYHVPKRFPAALFDAHGYIRFETEADLKTDGISTSTQGGKDWLSVRKPGIAALSGYTRKAGAEDDVGTVDDADRPGFVDLPEYDDVERRSVLKGGEVFCRRLHNKMTNEIRKAFFTLKPKHGKKGQIEFDVLLSNYDGLGCRLLIEAKPDAEIGSIRIAIGQLFDYRHFLGRSEGTDLCLLTIGPPAEAYQKLLRDLEITALWFELEDCKSIRGIGKAWAALRERMISPRAKR